MECCLRKIKEDDVIILTGTLFMHNKGHWFYHKFSKLS